MPPEVITSIQNERVKRIKSLKERKYRQQLSEFLLEGEHCISEAMNNGVKILSLIVCIDKEAEYLELLQQADADCVPCIRVSRSVMEAISDTRTPQGIAATAPLLLKQWTKNAVRDGFLVILENIQDPGNLGTIIRTADAAGAAGILLSQGCADIHSPKVVRSTMGSVFHLPIWQSRDLPGDTYALASCGWSILCGHLNGEGFYGRTTETCGEALVIGNEGAGVTDNLVAACTHLVRLPMAGKAESLNAAVAAGIMIYDIARRRGMLEDN